MGLIPNWTHVKHKQGALEVNPSMFPSKHLF